MNKPTDSEQELISAIARVMGVSKHTAAMRTVRRLIQERDQERLTTALAQPKQIGAEHRGSTKLTEADRIWNEIRDSLTRCAMKNMTIPQAKVFSIEATLNLGIYLRKLVDMELTAALGPDNSKTKE